MQTCNAWYICSHLVPIKMASRLMKNMICGLLESWTWKMCHEIISNRDELLLLSILNAVTISSFCIQLIDRSWWNKQNKGLLLWLHHCPSSCYGHDIMVGHNELWLGLFFNNLFLKQLGIPVIIQVKQLSLFRTWSASKGKADMVRGFFREACICQAMNSVC